MVKKNLTQFLGPHRIFSTTIYCTSKVLSDKIIHKQFDHNPHQRIQNMAKISIYNAPPSSKNNTKIQNSFCVWIVPNVHVLPVTLQPQLIILLWALASTWNSYSSKIYPVGNYNQIFPLSNIPPVKTLVPQQYQIDTPSISSSYTSNCPAVMGIAVPFFRHMNIYISLQVH